MTEPAVHSTTPTSPRGSGPTEADSAPQRQRAPSGRPGRRPRWKLATRGLLLAALIATTAWNTTRSDALAQAESAYRKARTPFELSAALRHALDHLDRRPWSREAAALAACCLSRLDFADEAEPYYRRAGSLTRDQQYIRAYGLLHGDRRRAAEAAYKEILRRWPDEVRALRNLIGLMIGQSRWSEARELAHRLAKTPGGAVVGHIMAGTVEHDTNNPDPALEEFDQVVAADPDLTAMPEFRGEFWRYYTMDLLTAGRSEDARRQLTRVLVDAPLPELQDDPDLWELLGQAYHQSGDVEGAARSWRRAVELEPRYIRGWADLGQLALETRRPSDAVEALEHALTLDPESYRILYNLVRAHRQLGHIAEADAYQRRIDDLRRRYGLPTSGMGSMPEPKP